MKLTLVCFALFSVFSAAQAQIPEGIVTICFPKQHGDVLNFLVSVARDRGFFEAEDLQIRIDVMDYNFQEMRGTLGTYQVEFWEMSKGGWGRECNFGTLSAAGAMVLPPERRDQLIPLYLSQFDSTNDMDLVVAANSKIKSVKELRGKKIDVGSLPVLLTLDRVLSKKGLKLTDVLIRDSNSNKRFFGGLSEGRYEAAFSVPLLSNMHIARKTARVLEADVISKHLKSIPGLFLLVDRSFLEIWPKSVLKFQRAMDKARAYASRHPEAIVTSAERLSNEVHTKRLLMTPAERAKAAKATGLKSILDLRKKADVAVGRTRMKAYYSQLVGLKILQTPYELEPWLKQYSTP